MSCSNTNSAYKKVVALPSKAFAIVQAEVERRVANGEPGDSYTNVTGEYVINWHNHLQTGATP
jgi:hypothetical protein